MTCRHLFMSCDSDGVFTTHKHADRVEFQNTSNRNGPKSHSTAVYTKSGTFVNSYSRNPWQMGNNQFDLRRQKSPDSFCVCHAGYWKPLWRFYSPKKSEINQVKVTFLWESRAGKHLPLCFVFAPKKVPHIEEATCQTLKWVTAAQIKATG